MAVYYQGIHKGRGGLKGPTVLESGVHVNNFFKITSIYLEKCSGPEFSSVPEPKICYGGGAVYYYVSSFSSLTIKIKKL